MQNGKVVWNQFLEGTTQKEKYLLSGQVKQRIQYSKHQFVQFAAIVSFRG